MYEIKLQQYRVLTTDKLKEGIFKEIFDCYAESAEHARNQAEKCVKSLFKKWVIITKD